MRARGVRRRGCAWAAGFLLGLVSFPSLAHAICDVIPGPSNEFRAAVGTADRPYAWPGQYVELHTRPAVCDRASLGLKDVAAPAGVGPEDVAVTVLFTPPGNAPRHAVVTATDCTRLQSAVCMGGLSAGNLCASDLQCLGGSCTGASKLDACQSQLGAGGVASCVQVNPAELRIQATAMEGRIRFPFPNTDSLVGAAADHRTLSGPATLAASPSNAALPCGLASTRCADTGGTIACADELYAIDGTCGTQAAQLEETFPHFTALPAPNDYEAVCSTPGTPCDGTATEMRFTTDAAGNVLLPMDYRGVLVRLDDVPVPRLVRGDTSIDAFSGAPITPIALPDANFLSSYSPQGRRVPPIFTPLADPASPGSLTLFGSIDAPLGVIRIARKGTGTLTCSAGANAGNACTSDAQCPGGECALFEFRDRYDGGVGPVVLPDTSYTAGAENPVPIDGLNETADVFAFVQSEAIQNVDLNGDGDQTDPVVMLRSKASGVALPIGDGGAAGRAATRVRELPFAFPAVATEGDLVAYLEPEPLQANIDENGDGDRADTILRVFRQSASGAVDIGPAGLCADAAPVVNNRSAVLSDGFVFFRAREASCSHYVNQLAGYNTGNAQPTGANVVAGKLSGDGTKLLMETAQPAMAPGKTATQWKVGSSDPGPFFDLFVRDAGAGQTTWASARPAAPQQPNGPVLGGAIAGPDDRWVFFVSPATNLAAGPPGGGSCTLFQGCPFGSGQYCAGIPGNQRCVQNTLFLHDRLSGSTGWINPAKAGGPPNTSVRLAGRPTPDGRYVPLWTQATNMVQGQSTSPDDPHLFLHDFRVYATTEFVDVNSFGQVANSNGATSSALSDDGRFVAFDHSRATNLFTDPVQFQQVQQDQALSGQVFLRDRSAGTTDVVSLSSNGELAGFGCSNPSSQLSDMSSEGRFVLFNSFGCNLVAGDTNGTDDVFLRDRLRGTTERVSTASNGTQSSAFGSGAPANSLSRDGRYAMFGTAAPLIDGDTNGAYDFYVRDRFTGIVDRISRRADGSEYPSAMLYTPTMDRDGVTFALTSADPLAIANDQNPNADAYVRTPDPTDPATDFDNDGDHRDTVLQVLDTHTDPPTLYRFAGIADKVAVAGSIAAFLAPEKGYGAGYDANDDGDLDDVVVLEHFAPSTNLTFDLDRAASDVVMSAAWIAVATPEAQQFGQDLNGDGDAVDQVVAVRPVAAAGAGPGAWVNVGQAISGSLAIAGSRVAFLTAESEQGGEDLNGDGDPNDLVLRVYDADSQSLVTVAQADEFVLGNDIVAFRTNEAAQGNTDLNGDGDTLDEVMQVYDFTATSVRNSGQAALACNLEACDPRQPYRVKGATVTYLTREVSQGNTDLNGDGDTGDILLQVFNARATSLVSQAAQDRILASVSGGVCTTSGLACASDADCSGGSCFVPPGRCVLDVGTPCDLGTSGVCGAGRFCQAVVGAPGTGTCREPQGPCKTTSNCSGAAICVDEAQQVQRLLAPVAEVSANADEPGAQILPSSGVCTETLVGACTSSADCSAGAFCNAGTCARSHGGCAVDSDCPAGVCRRDLKTATAADADMDGLADPIDNCPTYPNAAQADLDQDGIGDACDAQTCGNGIREGNPATMSGVEECDDGNRTPGDGCDATCQREATDCADGFDNDGDGKTDYGTGPTNDPSCQNELAFASESPQCDDGKDNDGDGLVDWPAETKCQNRFDNDELTDPATGCGLLGIEPLLIAGIARVLGSRRRRRVA